VKVALQEIKEESESAQTSPTSVPRRRRVGLITALTGMVVASTPPTPGANAGLVSLYPHLWNSGDTSVAAHSGPSEKVRVLVVISSCIRLF
jgi:hypothetical protein